MKPELAPRPISEKDFMGQVIQLAKLRRWRVHHQRPGMTAKGYRSSIQGDAGFPDLVLVRLSRVMFVELKSETGKLTVEQQEWIEALTLAGQDVRVWFPSSWPEIEEALE